MNLYMCSYYVSCKFTCIVQFRYEYGYINGWKVNQRLNFKLCSKVYYKRCGNQYSCEIQGTYYPTNRILKCLLLTCYLTLLLFYSYVQLTKTDNVLNNYLFYCCVNVRFAALSPQPVHNQHLISDACLLEALSYFCSYTSEPRHADTSTCASIVERSRRLISPYFVMNCNTKYCQGLNVLD